MSGGYSRETILGYLNNPIHSGLWSLTTKIDNPETFQKGLADRDKAYREYPPIPGWLIGLCLGDLTQVISDEDDRDTILLRRAGLIIDSDRFLRRSTRSTAIRYYPRGKKLSTRKKKSKQTLYEQEVVRMRALFPGLHNVVSDSGFDFLSVSNPSHFSIWLEARGAGRTMEVLSIDKTTLENLQQIIEMLVTNSGSSCEFKLKKVYTPEYKMFVTYFHTLFLASSSFSLSPNPDVVREINSSLSEVFEGKPDGAIRCCGLAVDFLLEEIFESSFREKAPNKPLGELLDSVKSKALEILHHGESNTTKSPIDEEFVRLGRLESSETVGALSPLVDSVRLSLHTSNEIEKRLQRIERKLQMGEKRPHPLFSESLLKSVSRATSLRNAGSHRGREELTSFHAATCMKGVLNLLYWWDHQCRVVGDWDASVEDVVSILAREGPKLEV